MQKPKISTTSATIGSIIIVLLGAILAIIMVENKVAPLWSLLPVPVEVGLIAWLVYWALPHGNFEPKDYYLWQVESTASTVRLEYKNYAKKRRVTVFDTFCLVVFILFGILFASFAVWAMMTEDGMLPILICVPVGLGIAANFAYNLWKTPLIPTLYYFDASKSLLVVEGISRFLIRQTIKVPFDDIEKVYGLSVKATEFVNHDLIRIDIANPKRYLIINSGDLVDSVAEVRFYLEQIAKILPNKIVDEVGSGKFWVKP
jgi:hypothetical protein